jgi:hypothetical protein
MLQSAQQLSAAALRAAVAVVASLMVGSVAHAALFQFADFHLINANQPLSFTNNSPTASATLQALGVGVPPPGVPVVFNFTSQSGISTVDRAATLMINPIGTLPTTMAAIVSGSLLDQPINPLTFSIIETATGKNLLTMSATSGDLIGITGSATGSLGGTKTNVYTSDYATFGSSASESFNFGLGTISPPLSVAANGFLNSFVANVNGQFSVDNAGFTPKVPEPASAALVGIGLLSITVVTALKRRRKGTSGTPDI